MSGPPPNKLPRSNNPREQPPSPIYYRPPSPWTAASPPPIISGPPGSRPAFNSPGIRPFSPVPGTINRSNQNSPMFGASGLRGTRGSGLPAPRPQWPTGPQPYVGPQSNHISEPNSPIPPSFSPHHHHHQQHQQPPQQRQYQPPPTPPNFYQQQRSIPTPTPPPHHQSSTPSYGTTTKIVPNNSSPAPYIPTGALISPMEYMRRASVDSYSPQYEYTGPPNPKSYVIYDDEDDGGLSTREIIANQSQDYIDEKLAEYQATISQLQEEQERVQKKTFVNWINSYLSKRIPPLRVDDLIDDLKDGTKLLALLEVLSGEKLPVERGRILRRPHFLSNANTALQFLASKRIKLVNINPADLVDGRPPVVLGLIWTIILYFQIEENSRALAYLDQKYSGSTSSLDSATNISDARAEKWKQGARKTLLNWVTNALPKDCGVEVRDFGASWRDGVAFLALIDGIKANLVNLVELRKEPSRHRLETAFTVAEDKLGIARLLDPEDVDVEKPDEKSIMTYVAQFLQKYPEPNRGSGSSMKPTFQEEHDIFLDWLRSKTSACDHMLETDSFPNDFSKYLAFRNEVASKEEFYNKIRKIHEVPNKITNISWTEISDLWDKLQYYLNYWLWLLDSNIGGEFGIIGKWLAEAEKLLLDNEIPSQMNEETASIISQKLEEHKQFFATTPQIIEQFEKLLRSDAVHKLPQEQLVNMKKRLFGISERAAKRRINLKFLEHKCCLIAFLNLIENKLKGWTGKYGRQHEVEQMSEQYKNFIQRNKIFQEFNKAFVDMQQVVEEYKRDGDMSKREEIQIDNFLKQTDERWKHVSTELRCAQNMLDEVTASWKRWNAFVPEFETWLNEADVVLKLSEDERLEFFQNISVWKDKYKVLSDSANLLVATCKPEIANEIKSKFSDLSEQWERLFAATRQYMHSGDILRNRNEFRQGLSKLQDWLNNAESILAKKPSTDVNEIKKYEHDLQTIQSEIEDVEELFKTVSKLFQALIQDLSRDDVTKMMNTLKKEKERLVRIRSAISSKLNLFHQLLMQQESLETGRKEIHQWLDDAENILSTMTLSGGRENAQTQLNSHKSFFSRSLYYKSMLDSKNKVFQNLLKSVNVDKSIDVTDTQEKMDQLNKRFNYVIQNSQQWENRLKESIRCWNNYKESEYLVADWIHRAETLINESVIDSKKSIEAQKLFFENVNQKWIQNFTQASSDLIKSLPENDAAVIADHTNNLQSKWRDCLQNAPLHLQKLEFRLEENVFNAAINEIENELHSEQQALNRNEDIETILKKNENFFRSKGNVMKIEKSLENMKRLAKAYAQHATPSDTDLEDSVEKNVRAWENTQGKIDNIRRVLQQIPIQWEHYHKKFNEIEMWMDMVDTSLQNILSDVNTMEEFEKERIVFQSICHEADYKREDMKWLVKTLDSLLPYTTEDESLIEQKKLEGLINRYKSLIPTIEVTMTKTEVISKCYTYKKEIHEVVTLLKKVREQTLQIPPPESLENVNRQIQEQAFAINQLDNQRPHVMSMIQRGKDLSKDVHAPSFISTEIKTLETGWNEAYNETVDKLRNLKGIQVIWHKFDDQKTEIFSMLNNAETELRSITPLQTDPQNVSSDLKSKRELKANITGQSPGMVVNLKELGAALKPHIAQEKAPRIDKDVTEIEKRIFNTVEHIKDRVHYLEDYSGKWNNYKDRLCELQNWAAHVAPKLIETLQSEDLSPEDKAKKVNQLQSTITEKMRELDILASEALELAPKEGNVVEAKRLKGEVAKLQATLSGLNKNIEKQVNVIEDDVEKWKTYKVEMSELTPWADTFETTIKQSISKPLTLADALAIQENAKLYEVECQDKITKLTALKSMTGQLSSKTNAVDEIDALNSKCNSALNSAKQVSNKYNKLVNNWKSLDNEINDLENWLQTMEESLLDRSIQPSPQMDNQQKILVNLKSLNNEVSEQQAKLIHLSQYADQIGHVIAGPAATELKERIALIKDKMVRLSENMRSRINDISDTLIARQEFNSQVGNFINWMDQMRGQIDELNIVNSEKLEPTIQQIHSLLQQHSEKVPQFNQIYDTVKNLSLNATPQDQAVLNETYSTCVTSFKDIENDLLVKRDNAIKWNEFLSWKNESNNQLDHIKKQIEKTEPGDIHPSLADLDQINKGVKHWKPQVNNLDNSSILEIKSVVAGKPLSAMNIIGGIEKNVGDLKFKVKNKRELLQRFEDRKVQFNEIKASLEVQLISNQEKLNNHLLLNSDVSNIEEILAQLEQMKKDLANENLSKNKVHDEGELLAKQDVSLVVPIQECLLVLDKNWDIIQDEVESRLNRYQLLNDTLKTYTLADDKFKTDITAVKPEFIPPKNEPELVTSIDKTKKTFDTIKKLKVNFEDLERKGNAVVKCLNVGNEGAFEKISTALETYSKEWQTKYNTTGKKLHEYETEMILCKHIGDTQNELAYWISETQKSLNEAVENPAEKDSAPLKLTKYQHELPSYLNFNENILKKIEDVRSINPELAATLMHSMEINVIQPLATLEETANLLQNTLSSYNEKEKLIRHLIKENAEEIGAIRESLLKCDDMSGDSSKVIERLNQCKRLKGALDLSTKKLAGISKNIDELAESHPNLPESIARKELANLQKRQENIILYANKIESTLSQFLNKMYNDKLGQIQRTIVVQNEKVAWCLPENGSDRYNLEVKKSSLADVEKSIVEIETQKSELDAVTENPELKNILKSFVENKSRLTQDLSKLKQEFVAAGGVLGENIDLWKRYEELSEQTNSYLRDIEGRLKVESSNQVDLANVDGKLREIGEMKKDVTDFKPTMDELNSLAQLLLEKNPDIHINQFVGHLNSRYQTVLKGINNFHTRIEELKRNKAYYDQCIAECNNWITDAKNQQIALGRLGSPAPTPAGTSLDEYKKFIVDFETGQKMMNDTCELGESMYSGITPTNREQIRMELRNLRDEFDSAFDDAKLLLKQVESVLLQKTSLEESYGQVRNWLDQLKAKVIADSSLLPNLAEKKNHLHGLKSQNQNIQIQKNALVKLLDKAHSLEDDESGYKIENALKEFEALNGQVKKSVTTGEANVQNHESFDKMIEKARDWLTSLKIQAIDLLGESSTFEKDNTDNKLEIIENLLAQKPEGDALIGSCAKQLQIVLKQTREDGHPALIAALDEIKKSWVEFGEICSSAQNKLEQLCSKWNEYDNIIEALHVWMQQKEMTVKDSSLKSSLETKTAHLNKLKHEDGEIDAKSDEIAKIIEQGYEIDGESDLNQKISKLSTRYQTLKKTCKENMSKYTIYVNDHKKFNQEYENFVASLDKLIAELKNNNEIVGNLNVLQERHNAIRDLADRRINEATTFETLLDQGEKLYPQTSPDGREIIRQQLRSLRKVWDSFSDDLNGAMAKLEQCLQQFSEFNMTQEQLTKWLKEVEVQMQSHVELKATLQEKKAQLQNHKLMHQEILSHSSLVDLVCDKAQQLVNQTKDVSLNAYLHSIKELFQNIVKKSEDLLNNLEKCVVAHQELNKKIASAKSWIGDEKEKLLECYDTTGEKSHIARRLQTLEALTSNLQNGEKILTELKGFYSTVAKTISPQGQELIQKEIDEIEENYKTYRKDLEGIEEKLNNVGQQWRDFERELDENTKWCRASENVFRNQPLQSTAAEKEELLNKYKIQRDKIIEKEKTIDDFVDTSHSLLNISGVERIKVLTSQLLSRYQLLQVLSKETVNQGQGLVENHKKYDDKLNEVQTWMSGLSAQIQEILADETQLNSPKIEQIIVDSGQAEKLIPTLNTLGENILSETSTQGREKIRGDLRTIRDEWDKLDEEIKKLQKKRNAQSLQLSNYNDALQQTKAWIESMENTLNNENITSWNSLQEIRSKLFKYKTLMQEITAHKRIIENITEKALAIANSGVPESEEIKCTIDNLNDRYKAINQNCSQKISKLDQILNFYQQFNELQKAQLDAQKNLWEKLQSFSDFSGNKLALQNRLKNISEIQEALPEAQFRIQNLDQLVASAPETLPARPKEIFLRDIENLKVDHEKFKNTLNDVRSDLENRLQEWNDYDANVDRLVDTLSESEISLKNYALKATLSEKQEQLTKYQGLNTTLKNLEFDLEKLVDDSSELVQKSGDTRLTVNLQQMTSQLQSIQATAKEIIKKCEQSVADHQLYNEKYKQCTDFIAMAQEKYSGCLSEEKQDNLQQKHEAIQELLSQQENAMLLLSNVVELGEKLYPLTSIEGREDIRTEIQNLQQLVESLYDNITSLGRQLKTKLSNWSGFEENSEKLQQWLQGVTTRLGDEIELKATLDEKRTQLQVYRDALSDIQNHQSDVINIIDVASNLPSANEQVERQLKEINEAYQKAQAKAQNYVERYEKIVMDHQLYSKSVMDTQEFVEANANTISLWGDLELERISLHTNLERLKALRATLSEGESDRVEEIRKLGEKVIPGTIELGQVNIRSQIDYSQQEWEGLMASIQSTIEAIEAKLLGWSEYETLRDQCIAWIRTIDNQLHSIDLKSTIGEKEDQLKAIKSYQGEIRAKELEIDSVTEKAQGLHRGVPTNKNPQISELVLKYQQILHKIKELNTRWTQYVSSHQEFDNQIVECRNWLNDIKQKLAYCSDLSASSQKDLEDKVVMIQDLLLLKDEGCARVQSIVELAQNVLANTAPPGHEQINNALISLQTDWSELALKMIDIKASLDDSINQWSGLLEQIQNVNKTVDWLENILRELTEFQSTMSEKRAQLERIKTTEEKVRLEKIDIDSLKTKTNEMLASGQQSQAAYQAKQILDKFEDLGDKVSKLLVEREEQYRDHRLYKEASDDLGSWINRIREKYPSIKQQSLGDKLAIENAVAPLEQLLNRKAQGDLLLEHLNHTGEVVLASTSNNGQEIIRRDMADLRKNFADLFNEIQDEKTKLEATLFQWRDYKEEYERLSEWLQQFDIFIKNHKLSLLPNLSEKQKSAVDMKSVLQRLEEGQKDIDKFNASASALLSSHLDSYVKNQLRHLNSRYQVQVNIAKDVLKKVETNADQHKEYEDNHTKARKWIDDARELIQKCSDSSASSSKEVLQKRLEEIQKLIKNREVGQNLVHTTVNLSEKILRNTRSDGKEAINNQIKELQNDWDRLVKKMSTAKVHLETNMLQWADYNSSYNQLQQWITDREAKLQQATEQKLSKRGQPGLSSGLNERKANLRQTNNIVQDIVSFEPMIQSVTLKASDLSQATPASEISSKYETLSKNAKDFYEKQKETITQHQALIDASSDFVQWLKTMKETLSKCSEPTGDQDALSAKIAQLAILESGVNEGKQKLEICLEKGEAACKVSEPADREIIEEELAFLQEEFDNYVVSLKTTKNMLENGIVKWREYDDMFSEAVEWLNKTETLVQSFNKLQNSLEEKKNVLEQFQCHLQTLFDWQSELDKLNMHSQTLLEICSDTRISNAVTQLTTKYNALLSLAKEIMRRLELHYQEHQQHNTLYEECQDWLERTREKLNECLEIPKSLTEIQIKQTTIKSLRQSLEQGQNKLRYLLELKEKIIMNTEVNGAVKIQEDTDNLKVEYDSLMVDLTDIRQKLNAAAAQLEEIGKLYKILIEWLQETESKVQDSSVLLNDLSEKKAALEKSRALQRDISTYSEIIDKINAKIAENPEASAVMFKEGLERYSNLQKQIEKNIETLSNYVNIQENYKQAFNEINEWIRKTKMDINQCCDSHGEREQIIAELQKLEDIDLTMPEGKILMENSAEMSKAVLETTGTEGQDTIKDEIKQLRVGWNDLQGVWKEAHETLNKTIEAWNEFTKKSKEITKWIADLEKKIKAEQDIEKKTPEDLERVKQLLEQIESGKSRVEDLNDVCESLMELSACPMVRDKTVEIQVNYSKLLIAAQAVASKLEKDLSDHTEFFNYKTKIREWLSNANEILDQNALDVKKDMKEKVSNVSAIANKTSEGQYLYDLTQEAFNKAVALLRSDKQDDIRGEMETLSKDWDEFTARLNTLLEGLKSGLNKLEEFNDAKLRIERWLNVTTNVLDKDHASKGDISEMKTQLERYKQIKLDIDTKITDLEYLQSDSDVLEREYKIPNLKEDLIKMIKDCNHLKSQITTKISDLDSEVQDHNAYYQSLQETEKWLLQISFQLMAHNSLYISNRDQTLEQINQHANLLDIIQRYQTNLDDLNAKGQSQINRYIGTNPAVKDTIETQLRNIQESYTSLLHNSVQIRNRLMESLKKFQEYEDTLDSIAKNIVNYQVIIEELDEPATSLELTKDQLKKAHELNTNLQNEKVRLALAIQACEAATASISRPSSPLEASSQPIPEKELMVRADLEDLIDQVQNHLSGISTTLNELEQQQKQRGELQDWIESQETNIRDIMSRPSKLRPDAAKQELNEMNDLLNITNEKRKELAMELTTGGFVDDDGPDLDSSLNTLESSIYDAIAKKQGDQNIIDDYRLCAKGLGDWFNDLVKRIDKLDDDGSCESKLVLITTIRTEFEDEGPKKLAELKDKNKAVKAVISNLDNQQVEEQMKSLERRYADIGKRIERKEQVLDTMKNEVECIKGETQQINDWIDNKTKELHDSEPLDFDVLKLENRQQYLKGLIKEGEGKNLLIKSIEKRVENLKNELEPEEHKSLKDVLKLTTKKQTDLNKLLKSELDKLGNAAKSRKTFDNDLEKLKILLKNKSQMPIHSLEYLPLTSVEVEHEIQLAKKQDAALTEMKEKNMNDFLKQANNLLKESSPEDQAAINKIIKDITSKYDGLKDKSASTIKNLTSLLQSRKDFEADVDKLNNWMKETEIAISAEIKIQNLPLLEEQLAQNKQIKIAANDMRGLLNGISSQAQGMSPQLSATDKLKLNEIIKNLKDKYGQLSNQINDKNKELEDHVKKFKDGKAKVQECVQFISKIQSDIKSLNKPIGSKVEDVEGLLNTYETILKSLKDNRNEMSEMPSHYFPELETIMMQQDDMIKMIEDQLTRLKQLLLLREQFIALVNDIITFIMKYTSVITEIEKSDDSIEDKIKRYDNVISKIQECEATLVSASDKGQQIAAEGSAQDRNAITEQLQSLKAQLQTLRKAVETQRQKHEITLAEHKKLANELSEIFDYLQSKEIVIKSRPLLERDPDSVTIELQKHKNVTKEINKYLTRLQKLVDQNRYEEGMPNSLHDMLSEARLHLSSIPSEIKECENYLQNNKVYRIEYMELVTRLNAWIHEAEIRLQDSKHGVDFENLPTDIQEIQLFFDGEDGIKNLLSQDIQASADKIYPSLNSVEQAELNRDQQRYNQQLKNTLSSAKTLRQELEDNLAAWKVYKDQLEKVRAILSRLSWTEEPVTSLAGIQYVIQKIGHMKKEIESQQKELTLLNDKTQEILKKSDQRNRQIISKENLNINQEWTNLIANLENKQERLQNITGYWKEFENKFSDLESSVASIQQRHQHIDSVVKSKKQLEEVKNSIEELIFDAESLRPQHQEVLSLSQPVLSFLRDVDKSSSEALENKIATLNEQYKKLSEDLNAQLNKTNKSIADIIQLLKEIASIEQQFNKILDDILEVNLYGENIEAIDREINEIKSKESKTFEKSELLKENINKKYASNEKLIPSEIAKELTSLEILTEKVRQAIFDMDREYKKARTVRTEYLQGVDEIQNWIQQTESKIQDRTLEPIKYKELLQRLCSEISEVKQKYDNVKINGKIIIEKCRNDEEKLLIQTTIDQLGKQLDQIQLWIDDKKRQVGDTLEAWTRFMDLYKIIINWAADKRIFLADSLEIPTLHQARHKLNEYSIAVKSIKPIIKHLSEMDKELEQIAQITTVGNLKEKLDEVEELKVEIEAVLLERHSLLLETSEEWEQYEKKIKDVRAWIDKTKAALDSPHNKKKSIRDQLGLLEKYSADISVQKTKITLSAEKLQVHFRAGIIGDGSLTENSEEIIHDLDTLSSLLKDKTKNCEEVITQIDVYQQQMQILRQKISQEEQQLRHIMSPAYMQTDRDKALTEQQACKERVKQLHYKLDARNERIKLIILRGTPDSDALEL